jgi:hypothetical protein
MDLIHIFDNKLFKIMSENQTFVEPSHDDAESSQVEERIDYANDIDAQNIVDGSNPGVSVKIEKHKVAELEPLLLPPNIPSEIIPTDISCYNIFDFELENYQSHPAIKAPLSN